MARFGFAAKGAVYITIGVLAARAAAGWGGKTTDPEGAIRTMGEQPLGTVVTLLVGLGLAAYATWRLVQALLDVDDKGSGLKGLCVRAGFVGSGVVYGALAATAFGLAVGARSGRSSSIRYWTARALSDPDGYWLVGLAGAGVMVAALYQFYRAYSATFEERLQTSRMSAGQGRWVRRIARFGLFARGVTFGIVGWFLVLAAVHANPREARGLGGALRVLKQQPYGPWLLATVALGLVAYGLFALLSARYRRIG